MNILLVTGPDITLKQPFNSGIEAFIVSLANQLAQYGHSVDVIARDAEPDVLFNIKNRDISLLDIDRYDVIHYNLFIPELYEVAARYDKPSFLTLHSPVDKKRTSVYKKFAQQCEVTFVAISDRIKQQWDPALDVQMPVIRNGINLNQWPIKQRADGDYFLWSARINEEKNVAAAIALAKHLKYPLKIAGRIIDQDYFNKQVSPFLNDSIEYVGHVTQQELSVLATNASAFLATATWQEPFGLAALEMLACGVQVIGFETAVPLDLRHDSVSTVSSTDWRDLIEPVKRAGTVSPQHCRDFAATMSIEKMALSYINVYQTQVIRESDEVETYDPLQHLFINTETTS